MKATSRTGSPTSGTRRSGTVISPKRTFLTSPWSQQEPWIKGAGDSTDRMDDETGEVPLDRANDLLNERLCGVAALVAL